MEEQFFFSMYVLVMLIIWWIGVRVHRTEIDLEHTETGSKIFIVGVMWIPVIVIAVIAVIVMAFTYLLQQANKISIN